MASSYYKLKRLKVVAGESDETYDIYWHYESGGQHYDEHVATKTVKVGRSLCPGKYVYLKYLGTDGLYRFMAFDRYFTGTTQSESIGQVSKLSTSFHTAQAPNYNIGQKATRQITASIKSIRNDQFIAYMDVFNSPRVYMQVDADAEDGDENWILVTVTDSGNQFKEKKGSQTFSCVITLPEVQTITM